MGSPPNAARRSFELLVAQVYEPLQRYLLRRVDPATADDVLGDVLLVLWRRLDDVPTDAPLPWAYGVARKCLANSRRAAARQEQLVRRVAAERRGGEDGDERLAEALDRLTHDDRELLRLWAWEQLPPREIGPVLGISANAAAIRLHRAKKRLRGLMADGKEPRSAGHEGLREGGRTR